MSFSIRAAYETLLAKFGHITDKVEKFVKMALAVTTFLKNCSTGSGGQALLDKLYAQIPGQWHDKVANALADSINLLTKSEAILNAPDLATKVKLFLDELAANETPTGKDSKYIKLAQVIVRELDGNRLGHVFYDYIVQVYFSKMKVDALPSGGK